jgi:hypothetical protein
VIVATASRPSSPVAMSWCKSLVGPGTFPVLQFCAMVHRGRLASPTQLSVQVGSVAAGARAADLAAARVGPAPTPTTAAAATEVVPLSV